MSAALIVLRAGSESEFKFGFCAVCLSRQHRDGRTWADGDDCVLAVKGGVVFPRTPHGPRRLGRYARGGWEQP
jgi:hypothetical protein